MDGGSACREGQGQALQAHAYLEFRIGQGPVNIGALELDDIGAVRAKRAASGGLAPVGVAYFEEDRAGQVFRCYGIKLQAQALACGEDVLVVGLLSCSLLACVAEQAAFRSIEAHEPLAADLEFYGLGTAGSKQGKAGCQKQGGKSFHVFSRDVLLQPGLFRPGVERITLSQCAVDTVGPTRRTRGTRQVLWERICFCGRKAGKNPLFSCPTYLLFVLCGDVLPGLLPERTSFFCAGRQGRLWKKGRACHATDSCLPQRFSHK